MSDRRPENPERLKNENGYIHERSRRNVPPDILQERLAQFDDLGVDWQARNVPEFLFDLIAVARDPVAVVRRGVESGTIKGELLKVEDSGRRDWFVPVIYMPGRSYGERFLVIPVSTEGET